MREVMKAALAKAVPRLTDAELDALTAAAVDVADDYIGEAAIAAAIDAVRDHEERQ